MPDGSNNPVPTPKPVSASRVTLAQLMGPQDANLQGNVHGGNIMKLMDEAGGSTAIRHSQRPVVTVAVDQVLFREPIHLGDLVTLVAELTLYRPQLDGSMPGSDSPKLAVGQNQPYQHRLFCLRRPGR